MQEQQQAEFDRDNKIVLDCNDLPVQCTVDPSFWNLGLKPQAFHLLFGLFCLCIFMFHLALLSRTVGNKILLVLASCWHSS